MAKEAGVMDFYHRFQNLQVQRETSDSLIKDLILYCEKVESSLREDNERLAEDAKNARLDLTDSIASRRELQKHVEYYRAELFNVTKDYDSLKIRNPYITILIDGDGLIFQDRYIQRGIEGGKEAAYELRRMVTHQCGQLAATMEVQAKVVANLNGLAKAMVHDGVLWKAEELRDFFWGFTQANPSFDFVDAGHGKERADSKIKENARWHLQNSNCKQVLLGISHDSGYAPFLDEILRDELTRRQVTILEGIPTVRDLVATGVNVFQDDKDLFRRDKLATRTPSERASAFERTMSIEFSASSSMTGSPQATSTTTVPTPPIGTNSPATSWAGMAQKVKPATPPPVITLPLANRANPKESAASRFKLTKETVPPSSILDKWNPGQRGLDTGIYPVQSVLDQIKKRRENQKICNNHFLRGPCTKAGCVFVHDYDPTDDELTVIAYLARLNPCTRGQDCDNDDCIYGHHCQSMKGDTCVHPYCKYPEDAHPPGTKYKNTHIDKNN